MSTQIYPTYYDDSDGTGGWYESDVLRNTQTVNNMLDLHATVLNKIATRKTDIESSSEGAADREKQLAKINQDVSRWYDILLFSAKDALLAQGKQVQESVDDGCLGEAREEAAEYAQYWDAVLERPDVTGFPDFVITAMKDHQEAAHTVLRGVTP